MIEGQPFAQWETVATQAGEFNGVAEGGAQLEPHRDGAQLQGPQSQGAPGEGPRRKRRRRRRGRGPREGQPFSVNDGGPDRLESGSVNAGADDRDMIEEHAPHRESVHEEVGINAPSVTPNAPSAPVWSLAAQHAPEPSFAPAEAKIEAVPLAPSSSNGTKAIEEAAVVEPVAAPETTATTAPEQSTRKGWWQRPFRLRD